MTRYHKSLGVCLVAMLGMWGCARGPSSSATHQVNIEKIKALEVRATKLEEDLKSALALKDQLRSNLNEAEQTEGQLRQEIARLKLVVKERDDLKKEREDLKALIKTRTAERDLLHAKYEGFLKELDELAGRAKAALQNPKPATPGIAAGESKPNTVNPEIASGEQAAPFLNGGF